MKNLKELEKEVGVKVANFYSKNVTESYLEKKYKALNNHFSISVKQLNEFLDIEKTKGYDIQDMDITDCDSTEFMFKNIHSQLYTYVFYKFEQTSDMIKKDVIAMNIFIKEQIEKANVENRFLLDRKQAEKFIKAGKFFQNALGQMGIDKETHDFILNVKNDLEKDAKIKTLQNQIASLENRIEYLETSIEE